MSYQINLETKISIKVDNCNMQSLTAAFLQSLSGLFAQYISLVLLHYFDEYYSSGELTKLLNVRSIKRKTTNVLTQLDRVPKFEFFL